MCAKNIRNLLGGLLLIALVGCGGGGGSAGTPAGSSGGTTGTATAIVAADFIFELDKQSLASAGNEKALLTVLAVDSNRNVVANVPVLVSVDSGGVFSSAVAGTVTDASGKYSGSISLGGNKSNRVVNAKISVSGIEKIASIQVIGSQISIVPVPATVEPGKSITINLSSSDSAGAPIPNVPILLSGTAGAAGIVSTDVAGRKAMIFNAPVGPGVYLVTATGFGVTTTTAIQVVSQTGGSFPDAVGVVSNASFDPSPSSILPNQAGATINRSKLTAKFFTSANQGIQNMRVRFSIEPVGLGSGEAISTGDAVVYSDAAGTAEAEYVAGTRSSSTDGVIVRACYKSSEFSSPTDCPNSRTATLTVSGTPLSITISDDNLLEKGLGNIAYLKKFIIQVNDSSGVAVKNAIVSLSVDITHYGKGPYNQAYPAGAIAPILGQPSTTNSSGRRWCINEDVSRNGVLDAGEDLNFDGVLSPRKAEIIVSFVNGTTTDANGQMLVQVSYGQNVGTWLSYTLRATTGVAGSEGDAKKSYITDILQADAANGSFITPPYGVSACNSQN